MYLINQGTDLVISVFIEDTDNLMKKQVNDFGDRQKNFSWKGGYKDLFHRYYEIFIDTSTDEVRLGSTAFTVSLRQ